MADSSIHPSFTSPLQVNQIGLYGGFIGNYEEAVEVVRKCTQSDPRFRTLAQVLQTFIGTLNCDELCTSLSSPVSLYLSLLQSMMSNKNGSDKTRTKYTFEGTHIS